MLLWLKFNRKLTRKKQEGNYSLPFRCNAAILTLIHMCNEYVSFYCHKNGCHLCTSATCFGKSQIYHCHVFFSVKFVVPLPDKKKTVRCCRPPFYIFQFILPLHCTLYSVKQAPFFLACFLLFLLGDFLSHWHFKAIVPGNLSVCTLLHHQL